MKLYTVIHSHMPLNALVYVFQPMIYLHLMAGHMYSSNDWRLTTS